MAQVLAAICGAMLVALKHYHLRPSPGMARFKRALARIEDHWLADLVGAVALFAMLPLALVLGDAWGFK